MDPIGVVLAEQKDVLSGVDGETAGGLAFAAHGNELEIPPDWERLPQFGRYVLLLPTDSADRAELLRRFYDFIAADFDQLADRARNVENISYLLSELERRCGPLAGRLVLDVGSGTGLSVEVAHLRTIDIIGVEISSAMADVARSRGMRVVAPRDLDKLPRAAGAICSYVLHFGIPPETLKAVIDQLSPSGLLVGNVHHGTNLQRLARAAALVGATLETWTPESPFDRHGMYVSLRR